jgi:dGTPase
MEHRKRIEAEEDRRLAPWAIRSARTQGRAFAEPDHAYRTCFQRDRDRVLHARAFRRLQYKTQVFVHHEGDHFRNRLTHTLEVAQIARTIARALGANEDLTEAIVLAHDLGHTPFGHLGERALHELLAPQGGFEHNRQSLRIVDWLELRSARYRGLNLSEETRAGILKHGKDYPRYGHPVPLHSLEGGPSVEAQIANAADSIAYNAHDVDDGLRSGLLEWDALESLALWQRALRALPAEERAAVAARKVDRAPVIVKVIDGLVSDLIDASSAALASTGGEGAGPGEPRIRFSPEMQEELAGLAGFLRQNLYQHHQVIRMGVKGQRILRDLWQAYTQDGRLLPPGVLERRDGEPPQRAIADYLASMTDRFAMDEHRKLFDPHARA